MNTWKEDVILALENLNGSGNLEDIYTEVERLRPGKLNPTWHSTVRREIETYSSDSMNYNGKEDLFYSVDGKGKGKWGLRDLSSLPSYFLVFQGDTYEEELKLNCLWAPISNKAGNKVHHHSRLLDLKPGDQVIHLKKQSIMAISSVLGRAYNSELPFEFNRQALNGNGMRVDLKITELDEPIPTNEIMGKIHDYLPKKYSPFNKNGSGNQGYLFPINKNVFYTVLNFDMDESYLEPDISSQPSGPSSKRRSVNTRNSAWQDFFKQKLYRLWGHKCLVTGIEDRKLHIGAHIKEYTKSDDKEKIDEYNGLILTPNADKLFEVGLISFSNDGDILISSKLDDVVLEKLGIKKDIKIKFKNEHNKYLEYHREFKFKH
jgi:putative restriction endonuclease